MWVQLRLLLGLVKVNVRRCDQGLDKVKVGQCKSVNGTEMGVQLPSNWSKYTTVGIEQRYQEEE